MAIGALYPNTFTPNDLCIIAKTGFTEGDQNYFLATSKAAYYSFIDSKKIDSQSNFSYIAQDRAIRYPANAEDLINAGADYVCWQNRNFDGQHWYGYITSIKYINPNLSEIHFNVDVIATFIYDVKLGQQYVRRRTPATDGYGEWINSESLPCNEYVYSQWQYPNITDESGLKLNEFSTIIAAYAAPDMTAIEVDNVWFSGMLLICNDQSYLQEQLQYLTEDESRYIYNIYLLPKCAAHTNTSGFAGTSFKEVDVFTCNIDDLNLAATWPTIYPQDNNGWKPNNYKLYLYPYTALYVTNMLGKSLMLKYENFNNGPKGGVVVNHLYPVTPTFYPVDYLGSTTWQGFNTDFGLDLGAMPQLGFASSGYNQWLSSNETAMKLEMLASAIAGTVGVAASVAAGNPAGVAKSGVAAVTGLTGTLLSQQAADSKAQHASPTIHTASVQSNVNMLLGSQIGGAVYGPHFATAQIPQYLAKQYDDYFSLFGYRIDLTLEINLFQYRRALFDYIETAGCHINANCPLEYSRKIEQIFDNGVRFWYNADEIGNYTEANLKMNSLH